MLTVIMFSFNASQFIIPFKIFYLLKCKLLFLLFCP
jgi:hypothetical protein